MTVTGLGGASVPVKVELWGPFASRGEIVCTGTPYWQGSFVAHGDGTTTTQPVRLDRAGYYTYRESIASDAAGRGGRDLLRRGRRDDVRAGGPILTSVGLEQVVRPGARIADRIHVDGLGKTPATIEVELYGPFASRAAIRCTGGRLHWRGRVEVAGNGEARTAPVKLARAGFYGFRERVVGVAARRRDGEPCGAASSDRARRAADRHRPRRRRRVPHAGARRPRRPARISIDALGDRRAVAPVAIDLAHGVLGIPADVQRTGWWRDGARPARGTARS